VARVVFIGTEEFSLAMIEETVRLGAEVVASFSLTREWSAKFPEWRDFGDVAALLGVEHHAVSSIRAPEVLERLKELQPDALLVMGIPQLLTPEMIASARLGAIATHPSLLPRNRGLNAIPWHLLREEAEGGLSVFAISPRMDDGPIIDRRRFRITLTDDARKLYDRVTAAGREMLPGVLGMIDCGRIPMESGTPQEERLATYLPKRLPDRRIDWMCNARRIYDLVRALTDPYGGAFGWLGNRRMTVWEAGFSHEPIVARPGEVVKMTDRGVEVATGAGLIVLRRVQVGDAVELAPDVFERERIHVGAVLP
jgi:methionyl-tRNA formyltransferase